MIDPRREPSSQHYSPEQLRSQHLHHAGKGKRAAARAAEGEQRGEETDDARESFDGYLASADGEMGPASQRALAAEEGLKRQPRKGHPRAVDGTVLDGGQTDGLEERRASHQEASVSLPGISADDLLLLPGQRSRKPAVGKLIDVHASADGKLAAGEHAAVPGKPAEGGQTAHDCWILS